MREKISLILSEQEIDNDSVFLLNHGGLSLIIYFIIEHQIRSNKSS